MRPDINRNEVNDAAADWTARIDRGQLSGAEQAALDAWLAADVRHRGAFARMQAIYATTERAGALGGMVVSREGSGGARRRRWFGAAIAATLLVVASTVGLYTTGTMGDMVVGGSRSTAAGQVGLPDGSEITLVERAQASAIFRRDARLVKLHSGKAIFSVAKDPTRPFTVIAGNVQVTAIGTKFSVSRQNGRVSVNVIEGIVSVERDGHAMAQQLLANQSLSFDIAMADAAIVAKPRVPMVPQQAAKSKDQTRSLAHGTMLTFEAIPLAQAVQRFNAAGGGNDIQVDPALANRPITGLFSSSDSEGFAKAVALSIGAEVVREGSDLIIKP